MAYGVLYKACSTLFVFFSFVISRSLPISLDKALEISLSLRSWFRTISRAGSLSPSFAQLPLDLLLAVR